MTDFYIKRNKKVYGSFSKQKIEKAFEVSKIEEGDLLSIDRDGPWLPATKSSLKALLDMPELIPEASEEDLFAELNLSDASPAGTFADRVENNDFSSANPEIEGALISPKQRTVPCSECGGVVSMRANACPHCGCPVSEIDAMNHSFSSGDGNAELDFGILRIERPNGFIGMMMKVNVAIDGQNYGKLGVNQHLDVNLEPGEHLVEVSGGGSFSGSQVNVTVEPSVVTVLNVGSSSMGGLQFGFVGATAITAAALTDEGLLDAAFDLTDGLIATAEAIETVSDIVDIADAASGLLDLFND